MRRKKQKDYLDGMKEWQENQYNPGHYTGEKMPHYIFEPGNRKLAAIELAVCGGILILLFGTLFIMILIGEVSTESGLPGIFFGTVTFIFIGTITYGYIAGAIREFKKLAIEKKIKEARRSMLRRRKKSRR